MKIIKCGGIALSKYEYRKQLYNEIKSIDDQIVLVVSAFKDSCYSTKSLRSLISNNYTYEMEQELITSGEVISSIIITNELLNNYIDTELIYKEEIGIYVETTFKMEHITKIDDTILKQKIKDHKVLVVPGFIGINQNNKIVSLNENGSDLTAIVMAKIFQCKDVYLYKNVLGLSSIAPELSKNYKLFKSISYDLLLQIVSHGNNIIQEYALSLAKENEISIHIQHFLNHQNETIVSKYNNEKVIVFQQNDNEIYIDGFNNKDLIENILRQNNLQYEYILPCNSFLKIVTIKSNSFNILNYLHNAFLKGEI